MRKIWLLIGLILAFSIANTSVYALVVDAQKNTKCGLDYCETTVQLDKYLTGVQITNLKALDLKTFLPSKTISLKDINYKINGNNITIFGNIRIGSANYWVMKLSTYLDIDPWWNTSFIYCKNITLTETKGLNRTFEPMKVNLTGLAKQVDNDDVRIVNTFCNNGGTEQPRDVISSNTNWAYVIFLVNYTTTDTEHKYSVYYNYPSAETPSYTSTMTFVGSSTNYTVKVANQYIINYMSTFRDGGILWIYYNNTNNAQQMGQMDDFNGAVQPSLITLINGSVIAYFNVSSAVKNELYECYDKNFYCKISYQMNPSANYFTVDTETGSNPIYWNGGSWAKPTIGNYQTIAIGWNNTAQKVIAQMNITGWTNEGCMRCDGSNWYSDSGSSCTFGGNSNRAFYLLFNLPYDSNSTFDKLLNPMTYTLGNEEIGGLLPTSIELKIDGGVGNITHECGDLNHNYQATINITDLPVSIMRDDVIQTTNLTTVYYSSNLIAGIYKWTGNYSGNATYNASSTNLWETVTLGTPDVWLTFNLTDESNTTCLDTTIMVYGNSSDLEEGVFLYENDTLLDNPYNTTPRAIGNYTFILNWSEGDCYEGGELIRTLEVLNCTQDITLSNISSGCCPISTFYCFDADTLAQKWDVNGQISYAYKSCLGLGCDNKTFICSPPTYEQDLFNYGIVIIGIIIFIWITKKVLK